MTDRLQAYYDYLEVKNHNRNVEQEQAKHNREMERQGLITAEETARAHRASEALQAQANQQSYDLGLKNVGVAQQNVDVAKTNADTNKVNAETQSRKEMHDYWVNSANANTNAAKAVNDRVMRSKEYQLQDKKVQQDYQNAVRNLDQAQAKLDLAWKQYELDKTDKTWKNVLSSINTFNSTVDIWARLTGKAAPTTTKRINVDETKKSKDGKITLKDVAKIASNLLRK